MMDTKPEEGAAGWGFRVTADLITQVGHPK